MRQAVARNLRRIRGDRSLTQEELAFRAEVNRSYISDLEQGKYSASVEMLGKLAKALNVAPSEFFEPPPKRTRRQSKP
ncbi:helix-turn-helix domain-containing protein [Inquilinus sp. Marseille-Q2685]|uniref:helix-turn-helix domain-containing protein n=1 Tax=Inquilinus sp. Marseille-Q2685 TaxID=2866581 RepID=UPI001CE49268|nr:helix-turn-helix transcriptional regulator [Inquilinus sp. Marseille-Q2685]